MLLLFDLIMRRALGWLGRGSSIRALELENAVLRHEVRLLRRHSLPGCRIATEIESLWTSSPRWMGPFLRETLGTAGSFPYVAPSAHRGG